MKICIVGAGAIGGWLGARLAHGIADREAVELSALARGATLAALRQHGLRLSMAGQLLTLPLTASDQADELGAQDLVIVAVKAPSLAAVAPGIRALLGPQTRVLVAMNGVPWWFFHGMGGELEGRALASVDPGGLIASCIPAERVIGCVVHAASALKEPGWVEHKQGAGLIVGAPDGRTSPDLVRLTSWLQHAGFEATLSQRIQRDIWFKLWGNMTMNPISALTGATLDRILDDELVRRFVDAVMLEAQAVGARIGCAIEQTPSQRHAVTAKLGAFKTSMLQDVEAGRQIELDVLLGAVQEIGQQLKMSTPSIDALFGLTRLMAQTRGLY